MNTSRGWGNRDLLWGLIHNYKVVLPCIFADAESRIDCFYSSQKWQWFYFCSFLLSHFLTLSKHIKSRLASKPWHPISCWLKSDKHNLSNHLHNPFLFNASAWLILERLLSFQSRGTPKEMQKRLEPQHTRWISDPYTIVAKQLQTSLFQMGLSSSWASSTLCAWRHFVYGKQTPKECCSLTTRSTKSFWMWERERKKEIMGNWAQVWACVCFRMCAQGTVLIVIKVDKGARACVCVGVYVCA